MDVLLPGFYENKSILRTWLYSITFHDSRFSTLKEYHVVDISVPFYEFEATSTSYGSITKSFVTLTKDRGLQFSITLEEDRLASVTKLIHTLQQTILNENGVYNYLNLQLLGNITVIIHDDAGNDVMSFEFVNCRFVGADGFSLAYSNAESLKHKINFLCDVIEFDYLIKSKSETASNVPTMPIASPVSLTNSPVASSPTSFIPPLNTSTLETAAKYVAHPDTAIAEAKKQEDILKAKTIAKVVGVTAALAVPLAKLAGVSAATVDAAVTKAGKIANTVNSSKSVGQAAAIIGLSEGTIAAKIKSTSVVEKLGIVKEVGNSANQAINAASSTIAKRLGLGKQ